MTKKRKRLPIVHEGAYKKGKTFTVRTTPSGDVVFPGTVSTQRELAEQYQILLALKTEAAKSLKRSAAIAQKLEKRDHLLQLAEQVDASVDTLENAIGKLHCLIHALVDFGAKPIRPEYSDT